MDELEIRRQLYADPHNKSDALRQAVASSPANRKLYDDIQKLDQQIASTLAIEPPDGLADRILLKQSFDINEGQIKRKARLHLAIAASVAFFVGLGTSAIDWQSFARPDMGSVALAHVQHEKSFLQGINESPDLRSINAKLASFGESFEQLPGTVTYVNHCSYHGTPSFHMVMQGKMGPLNIFIVPQSSKLPRVDQFSDEMMHGISTQLNHTNLVLVGNLDEPLEPAMNKLTQNLNQSI